jgi:type IV secretory pathway TrbL component
MMMRHSAKLFITIFLICGILSFFSAAQAPAAAPGGVAVSSMNSIFRDVSDLSRNQWLKKAQELCLQILAVTAIIGFAIGVKDLAVSGQITLDSIVALFVRYAFIIGLVVYLLENPLHLSAIPGHIKALGSSMSGEDISFGNLQEVFAQISGPLLTYLESLTWKDIALMICMTFLIFFINCLFFMMAATVLVVEIEAIFIFIGGLFTASFFVIGYFRDIFMGYIKGLAAVGVKLLLLCLLLGLMKKVMLTWPEHLKIFTQGSDYTGLLGILMSICCALVVFYMILQAIPQYASAIMTGSPTSGGGGMFTGAAAAGIATTMMVVNSSKKAASAVTNAGSTVTQAAQAFKHTSQAAKDTGSSAKGATWAGAKDAFSTLMTGPKAGGPRSTGDRIYADHQRSQQFADVRGVGRHDKLTQ